MVNFGLARERGGFFVSLFLKRGFVLFCSALHSHFAQRRGTPTAPTGAPNAKARASWSRERVFSDSSSGPAGSSHDRTDYNSTCTSYVGSSGTESGNWDRERWRSGAGPAIRETKLGGGASYQLICADGDIDGAKDGVAGGSGGAGGGGGNDTTLAAAGKNDEDGDGKKVRGTKAATEWARLRAWRTSRTTLTA